MSVEDRDSTKDLSDEMIVSRILDSGQNNLFAILFERYQKKVHCKCMSLLKNEDLAEEFVEEIFSKVFENLSTFQNRSLFSSWLYAVANNYCIDYLRNKKKLHYPNWNKENELPDIIDESSEDIPAINYGDLSKVLDLIHPEEKALILMKYQDGLSLRVIGESLRITEDAAKMRLKRAKARILFLYKKEFMDRECV